MKNLLINNKYNVAILIISVFIAGLWIGKKLQTPSDTSVQLEINNLKVELESLQSVIKKQAIDSNNKILSLQNFQQQKKQTLFQTDLLSVNTPPFPLEKEEFETQEQEIYEEQLMLEKENDQIQLDIENYNDVFEKEDVDEKWAVQTEQYLWDKFEEKELKNSTLLEADCRTTLCRLKIASNQQENFNPNLVLLDLFPNSEGFYNAVNTKNGEIITEIFVSRNNFHLPVNSPEDN